MSGFGYVLWWAFADEDQLRLDRAIRGLSRRFEVAPFRAHVSIATHFTEPPLELLAELSRQSPCELRVRDVWVAEAFFQKLTLELEPHGELVSRREALASRVSADGRVVQSRPHVSLLYSNVARERLLPLRDALRTWLCGPVENRPRLQLSRVIVMHCPCEEPGTWQECCAMNLSQGPGLRRPSAPD